MVASSGFNKVPEWFGGVLIKAFLYGFVDVLPLCASDFSFTMFLEGALLRPVPHYLGLAIELLLPLEKPQERTINPRETCTLFRRA